MAKAKNTPLNKEEAAMVAQPKPNHTEKIKSQVLAKIGKPPRLHRVEVCNHHNGKYRVNIWEQPEPDKNLGVNVSARIGLSYYLTVSETGEIIDSNPPMTKLGSSA
ncbi:MAG: hypothetical protein ACLP9L_13095 [Thermoguttaceae bacterium]